MQGSETEVNSTEFVTIFYFEYEWSDSEKRFSRWKLIVDRGPKGLEWVYTYNPALLRYGTLRVEFYRDVSMRPCIRIPKKAAA